ncbi:PAS domain S-box protein [Nitrincola sp.]|uniref:PAS domain S-box protein n=1 Tax=Nitrincola sp. TaxID=1926584 RepID=UPI003A93CCF6
MLEPQVSPAREKPLHTRLVYILALSLGYALLGILTVSVAFSEGYSVPFWPAAGLGLAALLIWGRGCWPGIWIGSLLVDLWMQQSFAVLLSSLFVATAASLQAVIAATLVQSLVRRPEPLAKDADLLRFLLLAGPLTCVIAPSVGVISQYLMASMTAQELRAEWLIWWVGDTLGVLLFAPIVLLLWQDRQRSGPQVGSYRIILPLAMTAILLLLGNYALARLEKGRSQLELDRLFEEISDLRFETLPNLINPLIGVERFFASSVRVHRSEFASYTRFITDEPAVLAIDWSPLVLRSELKAFERNLLHSHGQVFELGSDQQVSPLAQRDVLFPVLFSEPAADNAIALGLDHGFEQPRVEAMQQARSTGRPVMAPMVPLLRSGKLGVLVFQAVYQDSQHPLHQGVPGDELPLQGYVVGLYDIKAWLAPLVQLAEAQDINLRVSDVTLADARTVLWDTLPAEQAAGWIRDINIASRTWRLEMEPATPTWKPGSTFEEQLYLVFSVIAAFMAVFATLGSAGRYAATRAEVAKRTQELREELQHRRSTELALQESEGRYRSLIETAPFTILLQHEGRVVYLNSRGLDTFAAESLEQVVGHSVLALVEQDHRAAIAERIRRISAGETLEESVTTICLRLDGTPFVVDWSSVPYAMEGGFGSLVVIQDITARKEAEEQLDRFFSVSLDLLCIADIQGKFRRVNPAFTQILGWTEKELLSQPFSNLIHPDDRETTEQQMAKINTGERASEFKNRYLCTNGSWRWLEWKALPQPNGLIYASAHDVTLQHEATEQLQLLNDKLRIRIEERGEALLALNAKEQEIEAVLNNLMECVITIDETGIIQRVNPAATKIFGYAIDEMLGKNVSMLMPAPHRDEHDAYLNNYHQTGIARVVGSSREVEGCCKDGTLIPLELAVNRYEIHGQIYFTGTLRDISERRSLIYQLINARVEAEEASHAKSAFLATMSHEIRTPMNGVLGLIEVLGQDEMSDYQRGLVQTIQRSALSLLGIIDDILDFSKIEAGRLEINPEATDLGELVENLCNSLVVLALDKQVDLSVFISPDLPRHVEIDPVRMRQVLYNLVGNAIKFSGGREQRGKVSVRVLVDADQQLRIIIQDNGIGIQAERLNELFDPFTQAESDTTRRFGGTGLGLAISKRLVDMMQGKIRVESQPGQGSAFTLLHPMQKSVVNVAPSWPSLKGLSCVIMPADSYTPEDLAAYISAAGGQAVVYAEEESLANLLSCQVPPVVLITNGQPELKPLSGLLASLPHLRRLQIQQGRRRRARIDDPEQVLLDGDALSRQAFLQALSIAAGFVSPPTAYSRQQAASAEALSVNLKHQAQSSDQLILVAEDDDINQIVILQQLRLLGYSAEIADNGQQALEMWRTGRFSILLTDLHMPEMDGYELTGQIRHEEAEGQHFPILALTANALRGESDRAELVGMDAYLVKPVQIPKLQAALETWLPVRKVQEESNMKQGAEQPIDDATALLNPMVLSELVGGDELVMNELLCDYVESVRNHAQTIVQAWQSHDLNQIAGVAHKLKSSSRSVGALRLGELCATLEQTVKSNRSADVEACLQVFEEQVDATLQAIETYIGFAGSD